MSDNDLGVRPGTGRRVTMPGNFRALVELCQYGRHSAGREYGMLNPNENFHNAMERNLSILTDGELECILADMEVLQTLINGTLEGREVDPRERGDDDGVEYADPRDERDERLRRD